jgi:hypothetical protein
MAEIRIAVRKTESSYGNTILLYMQSKNQTWPKIGGIEQGKSYINKKTKEIYTVLHFATASWDDTQVLVVYAKPELDKLWVRSLNEFKEKFEEALYD